MYWETRGRALRNTRRPPFGRFVVLACSAMLFGLACTSQSQSAWAGPNGAPVSLTRGVLLAGGFRSQAELNAMSGEDQRNT